MLSKLGLSLTKFKSITNSTVMWCKSFVNSLEELYIGLDHHNSLGLMLAQLILSTGETEALYLKLTIGYYFVSPGLTVHRFLLL